MKRTSQWERELEEFVGTFEECLGDQRRRVWARPYIKGLLSPSARKSVMPMAERVCPEDREQLHHFVAKSCWPTEPLEERLAAIVERTHAGGYLIVDDTAIVKKGEHSVGVAHQYCGELGKQANCQSVVTLTMSREDIPVPIATRLYLPEAWCDDRKKRKRVGVPDGIRFQTKGDIALDEIRKASERGLSFSHVVADAGYGASSAFRAGLTAQGYTWSVGILPTQGVYPADVQSLPDNANGRPRKYPAAATQPVAAKDFIAGHGNKAFATVSWRDGTKGKLTADFARVRVRPADGTRKSRGQHPPGEELWLVCERRSNGVQKYYLSNCDSKTPLATLAAHIKSRWACEQAHEQLKQELGFDHFEGRSWLGLHHHMLLTRIAFAFLQRIRMRENKPFAVRRAAPILVARNSRALDSSPRAAKSL